MTTVHIKIHLAAAATKSIDELLFGPLHELAWATGQGNGAGVYADWQRVRGALVVAKAAIDQAHQILMKTDWPTNEDYDQC